MHAALVATTAPFQAWSDTLHLRSKAPLEFIDLTHRIEACVARSGVQHGLVSVQSHHTTAAIVVNEHEPLLLEDLRERLERFAPRGAGYRHDDFSVRTANLEPDERPNGHAHVRALVLPSSVTLHVVDARIALGRWQRIFLLELDGTRPRSVSLLVLGAAGRPGARIHTLAAETAACE